MTTLEPGQCSNKEGVAAFNKEGVSGSHRKCTCIYGCDLEHFRDSVRAFPGYGFANRSSTVYLCHKLPSDIQRHLTGQLGCAESPISVIRVVATPRTISCICVLRRQASAVPANAQSESLLPELGRNSALNVGHRPKAGPSWEGLP